MSTNRNNIYKNYNPDILETIANLSNDEVFTPPKLANEILDLLPEEIWSDSTITFLDPAVKTGIFLREITSRLIAGLAEEIPDLQERVNHILTKQVFGIGITELTTLMSRRTVYCSMTANGPYSICTEFDDEKGNIIFPDTEHTWDKNGRCEYCGANRESYGGGGSKENYAYPFIHDNFEKEFGNMKFDVIIGNPPYQLSDGAGNGSSTTLYDKFIYKAKEMNPKYISMIVPSRWFIGGKGLDEFRKEMINDKRIREIFHYEDAREAFSDVGIFGGINFFLWDKNYNGKCKITTTLENESETSIRTLNSDEDKNVFIVNNTLLNIVQKVKSKKEKTFDTLVSPRNPYNIQGGALISNKKETDSFLLYEQKGVANRYIDKKDVNRLDFHYDNRIFISFAYGTLEMKNAQVINQPIIPISKEAICSGTYLSIGPFKNEGA